MAYFWPQKDAKGLCNLLVVIVLMGQSGKSVSVERNLILYHRRSPNSRVR